MQEYDEVVLRLEYFIYGFDQAARFFSKIDRNIDAKNVIQKCFTDQ